MMKFAICNETFQDWPLERAFQFARQCGYEGIEFAPYTLGSQATEITAATRQQVRQLLKLHKLECVGLHWLLAKTEGYYLTSPDDAVRERTGQYFRELARLCHDLGGRIMVLGSPQQRNLLPGVTHEQAMQFAADTIRRALPALTQYNITLALEPLGPAEGDFLLTADSAIQLASLLDSPHVRLHLDVKAMSTETKSIPEILQESADYLAHFRANDPNRRGPGMGDLDFVPILRALHQIDYQGWVSVEVFDYEPGVERLVTDSIRYLQNCLIEVEE
jgi:sugar phosphate isomerase/epimerase